MNRTDDVTAMARRVMNEALNAVFGRHQPVVIVDSPPGAGKTWLCERLIVYAIKEARLRVCYVAPKVEQGCDLAKRLLAGADFPIDVLVGQGRTAPPELASHVLWANDPLVVGAPGHLVISNPQKLAASRDRLPDHRFDLLVVDEAYQVAAKDLLPMADLAPQVVMVGDPGQLAPTITIPTDEFESEGAKIHWPAPKEVLRLHPHVPLFKLPATYRLVPDTVELVQPSFYPALPFRSAANTTDRRLRFQARGMDTPIDRVLDLIQAGASIVALLLPGDPPAVDERDPQVETVIADLAHRLLQRGAQWKGHGTLDQSDIGVADSHVLSGGGVRARLQERNLSCIRVATPELWQGRECPIMLVKHPLNVGRAAPGAFDLDPGRFCVMLSRHLLACIVVGRASIQSQLREYLHDSRTVPIGTADVVWQGYKSHSMAWNTLQAKGRVISIPA